MDEILASLNEKQKEAVLSTEGPVIVFAGAGSGKTRTLTHRIAYMIKEKNISPSNILAITFTNRATAEMKNRLSILVGEASSKLRVSTFHAFCAYVLRRDIETLGYNKHFSIIDDEDQLLILNKLLKENDFDKKMFPPRQVQKHINFLKCFRQKPINQNYKNIYDIYEKAMKEENLLDYEDLLLKVLELFEKHDDVLKKYQSYYKYILIDEFQDTNLVQYEIMHLLAMESKNIFVVGDDDQSIYSFRGTNYKNMQLFKTDFEDYKLIHLTENYRSTQTILNGCNSLIKNNRIREQKELYSQNKGDESDVTIFQANDERDEARYVIDKILELKNRGVNYNDIAVLYRSSSVSRNFEMEMINTSIPYKIYGGISYLKRREVKDCLAYLKLIVNNNDVQSFERIVNVPSRGLGLSTIKKVVEYKRKTRKPLFDAIKEMSGEINKQKHDSLISFTKMIESFSSKIEDDDLTTFFELIIDTIGYKEYIKEEEDNFEERLENIEEFKSILWTIENDGSLDARKSKLIRAFDEAILADDKLPNQRQDAKGVTLSTVHSSKGLEFNTVFVVGLEEGIFPSSFGNNEKKEDEMEEERRIAYVATTRAKCHLFLSSARVRLIYGQKMRSKTSRFLLEFKDSTSIKKLDTAKINVGNKNDSSYNVGDKVMHTLYGEGVIVSISDGIGQICFSKKGVITKIMLNHPTLSKK